MVVVNIVFAGAYLVGNIGVEAFPPFLFTALRFAVVALLLLPALRWRNANGTPYSPRQWRQLFGFAFIMGVCVYSTMYLALALSESTASIVVGTQMSIPIAVLLGRFFLGEQTPWMIWFAIIIAIGGVMIIGFDTVLLGYPMAFIAIVLSAAAYAVANVINRGIDSIGVFNLNAWMALVAAPVMVAISWLVESGQIEAIRNADAGMWATVFYSSVAVSLIGHGGMFLLLRIYRISMIMPFYTLTPVFGVVGSILFFDEAPNARFYAGALLVFAGVLLVSLVRQSKHWSKSSGVEA